jgi:serine-type D-Ala-D-Ala carboxypeptidase/endopeptidase (penicillin-binding protein 4)
MKRFTTFFLYNIIIGGLLVFTVESYAQTKSALESEIDFLKIDADLKAASWSVFAIETVSGKVLAAYNPDIVLEPASVLKIVTTGAALAILGPDYRFETKLEYSGSIDKNGYLHGNLYITGSGDPTTGSDRFGKLCSTDSLFAEFKAVLRKNNIRHISGKIIADASVFTDNPMAYSWGWEDIGNYYASGAWGINVNENLYRLYFDAGKKIGDKAELTRMEPEAEGISFINHVKTGKSGSGDNVVIFGSPYNNQRLLEGSVPLGKMDFDVDGSLPDPPMYLILSFEKYLKHIEIYADSSSTTLTEMEWKGKTDTNERKTLTVHKSPPISEIIVPTNMKSVNLFAEALLKTIGRLKKNEGSVSAGTEAITEYWSKKGIDLSGFDMEDGCGLSRKNKISTRQLVSILNEIKSEKYFPVFEKSLPVAGVSGGMASMLKGSIAEKNLKAKTGNMEKIKSYAGYVKNAGDKEVAFAIIVNNYSCSNALLKQKLEKLMLLIAQSK